MKADDVEKVSTIVFTAVVVALVKRHGWDEADAWQLVKEIKTGEMVEIAAMLQEML